MSSVDFVFGGMPYSPTTAFSWQGTTGEGASGDGAAVLDFDVAAVGAHGVAGIGSTALDFSTEADGEYQNVNSIGNGAVTLDLTAEVTGAHGIAGAGASTLDLPAAAGTGHGVGGTEASTVEFSVAAVGAHGVAGAGDCTLTLDPAVEALHLRYEVRGEVRQGGVLVNRRARVYLRESGVLIGEADTVAGKFSVHTGFEAAEHYIVPIHMDGAATDWKPPVANRVASVLAQDA